MASTAPQAKQPAPNSKKVSESKISTSGKAPAFYRGGNVVWDFRRQPNFVPENFARIRNKSQAWYYKVTTIAMIFLIGFTIYGSYLGFQYYLLKKEENRLTGELIKARRKEKEAQELAKNLYGKILSLEKKVGYDAIRQSTADLVYQIAKRMPEQFYIQSMGLVSEDYLKDKKDAVIQSAQRVKAEEIAGMGNSVTINAKVVTSDPMATETILVDSFEALVGFRVMSTQTTSKGDGLEIAVRYTSSVEYVFDLPPKNLLPK